ncbi:hypothetical protein OPV22_029094 [Ensete ventricosum]|uniref:Uncharacterized protein n=1 Tax=Ensete ventricosum TaxID=4639 RepID=A0AAV8P6Z3_ENSVE|nr:hypothetical protein OPV22_029094 [Ensete ventricosum]
MFSTQTGQVFTINDKNDLPTASSSMRGGFILEKIMGPLSTEWPAAMINHSSCECSAASMQVAARDRVRCRGEDDVVRGYVSRMGH